MVICLFIYHLLFLLALKGMQRFRDLYHGISHLSLVFSWYIHKPFVIKIQVTSSIFHGI